MPRLKKQSRPGSKVPVQTDDAGLAMPMIFWNVDALHQHEVPIGRDHRIVDLQHQPGIDDGAVLLLHRIRDGVQILLFASVLRFIGCSFSAAPSNPAGR